MVVEMSDFNNGTFEGSDGDSINMVPVDSECSYS